MKGKSIKASSTIRTGLSRGTFLLAFCLFLCLSSQVAPALIFDGLFGSKSSEEFLTDPSKFRPSLSLPIMDEKQKLPIPSQRLRERIRKSTVDTRVEPVEISIIDSEKAVRKAVKTLAREGKDAELYSYITGKLDSVRPTNPKKGGTTARRTIPIDREGFKLIDPAALGDILAKPHHHLTVQTAPLASSSERRAEFLRQLRPFLPLEKRQTIAAKVQDRVPLDVDTELLPEFAKRMVRRFLIYRGPNCFHASLAFQNYEFTSSPLFNVRREEGYHAAMINYDELWRVLNSQFYEVKPDTTALNYGDILVFFDVEKGKPVSFRWIRHAAVYLFGNYTFSKGSKSPNTPYTVKTLDEEWDTWRQHTKNVGVKVFRRSLKNVTKHPPEIATDWLY